MSDEQVALSPQEVLASMVFDENLQVAFASLSALVEMDPETAVDKLIAILRSSTQEDEQLVTEDTSEDSNRPDPVSAETASQSEDVMSQEVQKMLAGHDATTSTLASILATPVRQDSTDPEVNYQQLDNEIEQLAPPNEAIKILAARLLGSLSHPSDHAVEVLIGLAITTDTGLRKEVLTTLGRIGDPKALPVILSALDAKQVDIRQVAVEALGNFKDCSGFDQRLAQMFDDPDPMTRQRSIQVLGEFGSELAQEQLQHMLDDEDLEVCRTALRIISKGTGNNKLIDRIVDLMFRFSGELRNDAAETLARLHATRGVSKLMGILKDVEQEERHWVCIDALAEIYADQPLRT